MAANTERIALQYTWKNFFLSLTALCLAGVAVWFGYVQFFTRGLENLPFKICEGTVERNMVIRMLPSARSAEAAPKRGSSGDDEVFSCYLATSNDSYFWGETWIRPVSKADWLKIYGGGGNNQIIRTSVDGIEALADLQTEQAAVYVPCTPPSSPSRNGSADYGILAELNAGGDMKETGTALRQTLTDITYQLTKHAYKMAQCRGSRDLPKELPRYG